MLHKYFLIQWIQPFETRDASMHIILIKKKGRKRKKYSVFSFSEHVQHYEVFPKINEPNLTNH